MSVKVLNIKNVYDSQEYTKVFSGAPQNIFNILKGDEYYFNNENNDISKSLIYQNKTEDCIAKS